jgi:excinuclease ABC subunit C
MNELLTQKISGLPKKPGVYFYKDSTGEIIYVGKAAVLRNRVRQYFQASRVRDPKTDALVADIVDLDWLELETELDALFVEAEMIRRYKPKYNILLRDDKSYIFVRIDKKSDHPTVFTVRRPLDDGAEYIGPFQSKPMIDRALRYLRRVFPYSTHRDSPKRACLQAQLGLCPGIEADMTSLTEYRRNLSGLARYLRGERVRVVEGLEKEMQTLARKHQFEQAAKLRNRVQALKYLDNKVIFSDIERLDMSRDHALRGLQELLDLPKPPARIEGFDISHMSGTDNVASNVVFSAGLPDKPQYRKYKMRILGNDDFAHMHEVITRRLSEKNVKKWGVPDLLLIDGGKGQVSSAHRAMTESGYAIPMIGLAKQYEDIIVPKNSGENLEFSAINLGERSEVTKLLQRIRDESHRFAVSYHSTLKRGRQIKSVLEDIPGVGPATKKQLLRVFGSTRGVSAAAHDEIANVVGERLAAVITQALHDK